MAHADDSRVLIAAADPGLRQQLYKRLLDENVFSDMAADGAHALERLATMPYAVVLLDIDLPVVSADRVVDAIGRMPERRRPVVLVLASSSAARSLDVDVVQVVLRKPLNLKHVAEMVSSCIRAAGEPSAAPKPVVKRVDDKPAA